MSDQNPLINIGDLAKPANTLIEKISDAVEGVAKPFQIVRTAKAHAEANKILALADVEITEIRHRAITRLIIEEEKKQANMEAIIRKALPEVTDEARPEEVERDWISHFFDKCRLISDQEMQKLWAQVLAGQTNSPGSYSKRTIEILSNLEKDDAALFTTVCRFSVHGPPEELGETLLPLIYDVSDDIYKNNELNFASLAHLESLGLLYFKGSEIGYAMGEVPQRPKIFYFNTRIPVQLPLADRNDFSVGQVLLSYAGQQLSTVCEIEPIDGFVDYLSQKWQEFRYLTGPDFESDDPAEDEDLEPID